MTVGRSTSVAVLMRVVLSSILFVANGSNPNDWNNDPYWNEISKTEDDLPSAMAERFFHEEQPQFQLNTIGYESQDLTSINTGFSTPQDVHPQTQGNNESGYVMSSYSNQNYYPIPDTADQTTLTGHPSYQVSHSVDPNPAVYQFSNPTLVQFSNPAPVQSSNPAPVHFPMLSDGDYAPGFEQVYPNLTVFGGPYFQQGHTRHQYGGEVQYGSSQPYGEGSSRSVNPPNITENGGCTLNVHNLPNNHGLLLNTKGEFLYPTAEGNIHVTDAGRIVLNCLINSYSERCLHNIETCPPSVNLVCENGVIKMGNGLELTKDHYDCKTMPLPHVYKILSHEKKTPLCSRGLPNHKNFKVGFPLVDFYTLYEVCADISQKDHADVLYVKMDLDRKKLLTHQIDETNDENNDKYICDNKHLCPVDMIHQVYDVIHMRETLKHQLGSDMYDRLVRGGQVNGGEEKYFLTQGQLVSDLHFLYRYEQAGAFMYANVKPMWNHLKQNNWRNVELAIREFVIKRINQVTLYSGTSGYFMHNNADSKPIRLSLGWKNDIFAIVPLLFWKIMIDPRTQDCVAIIGVNSPYVTNQRMCPEVTDLVKWLKLESDADSGVVYACRCHELNLFWWRPEVMSSGQLLLA